MASALIGGGLSLISGLMAGNEADKDRRIQQDMMNRMSQIGFNPFSTFTPGGAGVGFTEGQAGGYRTGNPALDAALMDSSGKRNRRIKKSLPPNLRKAFKRAAKQGQGDAFLAQHGFDTTKHEATAGGANLNYGEFAPFQQLFQQEGLRSLQQGLQGQGLAQASNPFLQSQALAEGLQGGAFGGAQGLMQSGFGRGLQGDFLSGGSQFAQEASQGFDDLRQSTLDTLRAQAQPFEDRAFGQLQENLFGTGRMGTSGGALQTEAFARGLGQADLQRQLAATGEARATRGQAGELAQGFGNEAGRLRGVEDILMNNAFSRFGNTTGLVSDLNNQQWGRGSQMIGQGAGFMGGMGDILNQVLGLGEFGANLGQSQADIALRAMGGAGSQAGNLGPTGNDMLGGMLGTMGSGLGGFGGAFDALGGMFNKPTAPTNFGDFTQSGINTFNTSGSNPFAGMFNNV